MIVALLAAIAILPALAVSGAPDSTTVPAIAFNRDGIFHVYAVPEDLTGDAAGRSRRPSRIVAPDYPAAARGKAEVNHLVSVMMHITASGTVDAVTVPSGIRPPDPVAAAFDSASARAARDWRWIPSDVGPGFRGGLFEFATLPGGADGEGDLCVRARESVSLEPLPEIRADVVAVRPVIGFRTSGGFLLPNIPAGSQQIEVPEFSSLSFKLRTVPVVVHDGKCDTVDVLLDPATPPLAGNTFWSRPAAPLPVRDEDFQRFPRATFHFVYEQTDGQRTMIRLDSGRETFYELAMTRVDTTIHLALSPKQLDRIYRQAIETRLFDMPGPHPAYEGNAYVMPHEDVRFVLTAGGITKELGWEGGRCFPHCMYPSDEWKRVYALEHVLFEILGEHAEYRSLPPPDYPNM